MLSPENDKRVDKLLVPDSAKIVLGKPTDSDRQKTVLFIRADSVALGTHVDSYPVNDSHQLSDNASKVLWQEVAPDSDQVLLV